MPKRPRFKHPLRQVRTAIGMSQAEFAKALGFSPHTIQAVENGKMRLSYALEGRIFVETGADTREIARGRKGKALDQNGQPYSKEFYDSWKARKDSYDSSAAL